MNILFVGDIFGKTGIKAVKTKLDKLKKEYNIDFTIVNAENATNCRGLSICDYNQLIEAGVDMITMGNHTWKQRDYVDVLAMHNVVRPLNIKSSSLIGRIGKGTTVVNVNNKRIRITNILGSSIYNSKQKNDFTNPFIALDNLITDSIDTHDIHIIDFHSETTSEKNCALICFKNKVTAIIGTHTHVQTNDAKIVDNTAYITDAGMTGPSNGIIGAEPATLIDLFYEKTSFFRLKEAIDDNFQLSFVVISIDDKTNKVTSIFNKIIYK